MKRGIGRNADSVKKAKKTDLDRVKQISLLGLLIILAFNILGYFLSIISNDTQILTISTIVTIAISIIMILFHLFWKRLKIVRDVQIVLKIKRKKRR